MFIGAFRSTDPFLRNPNRNKSFGGFPAYHYRGKLARVRKDHWHLSATADVQVPAASASSQFTEVSPEWKAVLVCRFPPFKPNFRTDRFKSRFDLIWHFDLLRTTFYWLSIDALCKVNGVIDESR